jgi:Fur family peroxide stress response transcriptional regulator
MKAYHDLREKLIHEGFKVTPQRIGVLDAVKALNHPSADQVLEYIKEHHPSISTGTVYNILESFVDKGLIRKVKTDKGTMRYDAILETHHHLYCSECDKIEDYYDEELDKLLDMYFKNKGIKNFEVEDIKLQIVGKFNFNNK